MTERERGFPAFWISAVHALRFPRSDRCLLKMELWRPGGGWEREEQGWGGDEQGADRSGECWDFEYQRGMGCGSFGLSGVFAQWN
jgi:hypothetical protein